nr:site-specific DNA-methyltransferase [Hymenobacter sp. 15J16-1T3B]
MGRAWDRSGIVNDPAFWAECLRVLKPGAHLVNFSHARTYHRMACAVEDAGFELRDQLMWLYGSGFPKSKNLAGDWDGWGTALKPAHEPIVLARKPLEKGLTVADNVAKWGTGALHIDACRVNPGEFTKTGGRSSRGHGGVYGDGMAPSGFEAHDNGRWPANLLHDGSAAVLAGFPDEAGARAAVLGTEPSSSSKMGPHVYDGGQMRNQARERRDDLGSAARFFYCAKASRADRNEGLPSYDAPAVGSNATMGQRERADWPARNGNHHPTVKPTRLMRWLCRLITPPSGRIVDPFAGSGSTGKAGLLEGFDVVLMELQAEHLPLITGRCDHALDVRRRYLAQLARQARIGTQTTLFSLAS